MGTLRETTLVDAAVPATARFRDAARVLAANEISAVAVLDEDRKVVGLFTDDDLLSGIFPGYLGELRHTAFLELDTAALAARLEEAGDDPVSEHMREPQVVEQDTSAAHVAEVFLHCPFGALAVVDADRRFVGMVGQVEFCRTIMRRLG